MGVRRTKGVWCVDFQVRRKRHRYVSPEDTREGALAFEALLRRELVLHGTLDRIVGKEVKIRAATFVAFSERWLTDYVDVNNRPAEQRAKRHVLNGHLLPVFGTCRLDAINSPLIEQFKAEKQKDGLAPKTINNILTVLRKCLTTAVEWGELKGDIPRFKFLKTTLAPIRYLTPDEMSRLIVAFPVGMWRTMLLTGLQTGLRFSELVALSWEDVDLARRQLCVRRSCVEGHMGLPKNGRIRYVFLTYSVCEALDQLSRNGELVFQHNGKRIVYEAAYSIIERACKQAGINRIAWHTLRKTFASTLVMRGASLQAVKDLLGHATMNVTLRYAHLAPDVLRETVALLEPSKDLNQEKMSAWCQPAPSYLPLLLPTLQIK